MIQCALKMQNYHQILYCAPIVPFLELNSGVVKIRLNRCWEIDYSIKEFAANSD